MRALLEGYRTIRHPRNVGLISLSHGVDEFYSIVFPPIVPLLIADLGITYARAGLLLTVFFVIYSVFQLPAGLVADRVGKKRLRVLGLAGVSGSTYHPTGMSLVSDFESETTEGEAVGVFGFGVMQTASAVGSATGPALYGVVATDAGIGVAFPLIAAVSLLIVAGFLALARVG